MLYKLSLNNIRKSFRDYAIYFVTLILGVCIFYVFNSIESQTVMLNIKLGTSNLIDIIYTLIDVLSVFVAFILGLLVIYASRFLIKKRNKEFAIYMTLGMSKKEIAKMLLLETLIIGLISLGLGILAGILASQVTSIFVGKLFEADLRSLTFVFSQKAMFKTIIYFGIIYLVVMVFNTVAINKCKLIDLIQYSKKAENIKIKNQTLSIILFIISIIMLAIAYYLVTDGFYKYLYNHDVTIIIIPIVMGIIGTILFFYSIAGMLLGIVTKFKNIYYKNLNSFIFKNISSKINTMVVSISLICIMLFLTICLLASSLSIKNYLNSNINKYSPVDTALMLLNSEGCVEDLESFLKENEILDKFSEYVDIKTYQDKEFTFEDSLGYDINLYYGSDNTTVYLTVVELMSESDYNKLANIMNLEGIDLDDDQYAIISNYDTYVYDKTLADNTIMNIFDKELRPYRNKTIEGNYWISEGEDNLGFFVVSDEILKGHDYIHHYLLANYKTNDKDTQEQYNLLLQNLNYNTYINYQSKINLTNNSIGLSAISTFIGLYLGIIFMISAACIIALKELSDNLDDKDKYQILRNIGTDEKMINQSMFKQTLLFFALPICLAIIHSIFGLRFAVILLDELVQEGIVSSIITTSIIVILIYGGYFIVTYLCNKGIIRNTEGYKL